MGLANRSMMKPQTSGVENGKAQCFTRIFIIAFPMELVGEGEETC